MQGVESAAFAFDRACLRSGVRYAFVGGLAVMAWGQPRATADVDALLELPVEKTASFVEAARQEGFSFDARDFDDARVDRSHVTLHHPASGFHVDIKLVSGDGERSEISGASRVTVGGGAVVVPMPEHIIAYKVLYGSPQDLADARSILIRQHGRLDRPRLRQIARDLGVEAQLDTMIKEADDA